MPGDDRVRNSKMDPVSLEVCRHSLIGVAEEMGSIMKRAAFSPMIKERDDRSCALFTPELELIAQAEHLPLHLALLVSAVPNALEAAGRSLGPGDMLVHNDPYIGGSHLPDFTTILPIYANDELLGYSAVVAHMTDVGGSVPGGLGGHAREIVEEGIRVPPVLLYEKGALREDVMSLICSNVRLSDTMEGDLLAQAAATRSGAAGMLRIARKFGSDALLSYMHEIIAYTERRTRAELLQLPQTTATFEDFLDDDGNTDEPLRIRVAIDCRDGTLGVDFTGSSAQREGPVNASLSVLKSATFFVLRCLIDASIPTTAGCFRPIELIAPEGTIVNARFPAPVAGGSLETAQRIVDTLLGAFAEIVPDRVTAAGMGSHNSIALGGHDPSTGRPFVVVENIGGGSGARASKDGLSGVRVNVMNTPNNPIEVLEREYPLLVERYELRPNSGGPGRFRGGLGLHKEYRMLADTRVSILSDRHEIAPWGLLGGGAGATSRHYIVGPDGVRRLPSKVTTTMRRGELLVAETAGGGGFGDRRDRPRELVASDIADGIVDTDSSPDDDAPS